MNYGTGLFITFIDDLYEVARVKKRFFMTQYQWSGAVRNSTYRSIYTSAWNRNRRREMLIIGYDNDMIRTNVLATTYSPMKGIIKKPKLLLDVIADALEAYAKQVQCTDEYVRKTYGIKDTYDNKKFQVTILSKNELNLPETELYSAFHVFSYSNFYPSYPLIPIQPEPDLRNDFVILPKVIIHTSTTGRNRYLFFPFIDYLEE